MMIDTDDNVEKWVRQYIFLRDRKKDLETKHRKELEEVNLYMDHVAGNLQTFLDNSGVESASTKAGTVYTTVRHSASLADPSEFMKFVIANEQWDLLDRRANVTACRDYVKEHDGNLPPGVNLSSLATVGVRRPTGK